MRSICIGDVMGGLGVFENCFDYGLLEVGVWKLEENGIKIWSKLAYVLAI